MYTGTLIDELMAAVERVETRARTERELRELERWFAGQQAELGHEQNLLGVA
jgi:hypothetical protein